MHDYKAHPFNVEQALCLLHCPFCIVVKVDVVCWCCCRNGRLHRVHTMPVYLEIMVPLLLQQTQQIKATRSRERKPFVLVHSKPDRAPHALAGYTALVCGPPTLEALSISMHTKS
jgi:hypothetical protein